MINFIKDAVTAVSGIKSFLFNTDYRNNFDLQNVEFPCCVLTPIMRTNYDLNNIIRESAELQLSVVDLAPYEYTGDDLYDINKRCSDLALQVIANLQVKSKLDKELTFEFILPSGDELVSGVMCNLQCTMKQGSCIGVPSYVEVIVQPIKKESITSNGTYHITPSSGFNAMREVEVDVNIGELTTEEKIVDITSNGVVEILPTKADAMTKVTANVQVPPPPLEEKQVTITKAKTTEIITPDAEYGLSRVEVSTDIPLESKQITITENGTTTIEASEGFEGIESVEVTTDVNTLQGFDFEGIFGQEQANKINNYYKAQIDRVDEIVAKVNKATSGYDLFVGDGMIFCPTLDMSRFTTVRGAFSYCYYLTFIEPLNLPLAESAENMFMHDGSLTEIKITAPICKFYLNFALGCYGVNQIELGDVSSGEEWKNAFYQVFDMEYLYFRNWKKGDISVNYSSTLRPESIHYIIQNAMDIADGATARTLTLQLRAKANWQNSEYYEQDLAVLSTKGITIA